MADILKYRLPDGTEAEVTSNTSSVTLPFTTPHLDFTVILDQLAVNPGEVRGWYVSSSTYFSPTLSGNYNYRLELIEGQTRTVTIQTVDAKNTSDLNSGRFSSFRDNFSITVTRGSAPADSSADSTTQSFLTFPDSDARLTIEGNQIVLTDSNFQFNISALDVIDSAYIQARQAFSTFDSNEVVALINANTPTLIENSVPLDSSTVSAIINNQVDSNYVSGRQIIGSDSASIITIVNSIVDSAYVSLRDRVQDSGFVTGIVDAAYVQARDRIRDSGFVTNVIDSNYIISILDDSSLTIDGNGLNNGVTISDGSIVMRTGTGSVAAIDMYCEVNNIHRVRLKAPSHSNFSGNPDVILPNTSGTIALTSDITGTVTASYIQANQTKFLDSSLATQLIDASYIQARQLFDSDTLRDSGFITGIITPEYIQARQMFDSDTLRDSGFITGIIDSDYINNRTASGTDSTAVLAMITTTITPGYIQARQLFDSDTKVDSAFVTSIVDAAYVQARDRIRDSGFVTDILLPNEFAKDSAVKLYFAGTKKFETTDSGVDVQGDLTLVQNNARIKLGGLILRDSNGALAIKDSAGIATSITFSNQFDSSTALSLIDSAYVQARQVDLQRESGFIIGIVDTAYVQARQSFGAAGDSTSTIAIIQSVVNNSYVQARQTNFDFLDSGEVINLIDSNYVQARQVDLQRDSGFVTGIITPEYIQARQLFDSDTDTLRDSGFITGIIDSDYINNRTSSGVDSATVLSIVDSDYISAVAGGFASPRFKDFKYIATNAQTTFTGNDANSKTLALKDSNFAVYLNGIRLLRSDYTSTNTSVVLDSAASTGDEIVISAMTADFRGSADLIDSAYIQERIGGVISPIFTNFKFIADGNQTEFFGNDANGNGLTFDSHNFNVLLNGIQLDRSDYHADAGANKIFLVSGATASDELVVNTLKSTITSTLQAVKDIVTPEYIQARQLFDSDTDTNLSSTDSLSEGSTNLYFTNERVDDRVGSLITAGVNVATTYDDAAGTLEIRVPFENIDDRVGTILTAGNGININYDDPNATITITNTLNTSDFADSATVISLIDSAFGQLNVGVIDTDNVFLQGATDHAGIAFGSTSVLPFRNGNYSNATTDLGHPTAGAYKDAYLSGGLYVGGTGSANYLDDYEEGTWTPTIVGTSNTPTFYNRVGRYTKIGRLVTLQCFLQTNVAPTYSNANTQFKISGVPFNLLAIGYTGAQGTVNSQALRYVSGDNDQNAGASTGGGHLTCGIHADEQLIFHVTGSGQSRGFVENSGTTSGFILEATISYFTDA